MCTIAVASSVAAIGLGKVYWLSRFGFANPLSPVLKSIGIALLLINAPYLLWWRTRRGEQYWYRSYPFVWLATLAVVAAIGRAQIELGVPLSIPLAIIGLAAFAAVFAIWTHFVSLRFGALLVIGSGFFSVWAAGVVWGRIYKSPLFIETLMATGIVHHDGITLAALGNMLRTYHAASMGLDGVAPYMAYHWGTPWLFAQLSNLTDMSVLEFYQLGYPITMIPLFFGGILTFGAIVRWMHGETRAATRDPLYWLIFVAATIGVMPIAGMDAVGVWTSNLTISESYAVGIPVGLMLLAATMSFWKAREQSVLGGTMTWTDYVYVAVVLPIGLVALGYLKISLMILGFGALVYAALRVGAFKRTGLLVIGAVLTVVIYITYTRVSLVAHHEGIVPLDFLQSFVPMVWWQFFVLFQLFWSLVYIVLRLRQEGAHTVGDAVTAIKARRVLDVEIVAVVAIAGILPGFILHIDGGSAFYFSDVQRWIAVGLLLGAAPLLIRIPRVRLNDVRVIAIVLIALPLAISTIRNAAHWTLEMLRANAQLRAQLYADAGYPADARLRALPHLLDARTLSRGLHRSINYNVLNGLLAASRTPMLQKTSTAVFVPQSDSAYWGALKRPGACSFSSFLVPAITGMSMIDGMPPYGCKLSKYYGLSLYQPRTRLQTTADMEPSALCIRAGKRGFSRVLTLRFDAEGHAAPHLIECTE